MKKIKSTSKRKSKIELVATRSFDPNLNLALNPIHNLNPSPNLTLAARIA